MAILRVVPDIDRLQRPDTLLQGPCRPGCRPAGRKHPRKSVSAVARHVSPPPPSLLPGQHAGRRIDHDLPPSMSISGTASSLNGNITEPRDAAPPDTSIVDPAPKSWKAITLPQSRHPGRPRRDRSGPPRTTRPRRGRQDAALRIEPQSAYRLAAVRSATPSIRASTAPFTVLSASTRYCFLPVSSDSGP